jgi:hypothetical protein
MKIYLAGCTGTREREFILIKRNNNHRLFSYFYHGKYKVNYDEFKYRIELIKGLK